MTDISRTSFSARPNCRSFKNTFVIKKLRAILNAKKAWRHLRRTILLGSQYILTRLGPFGLKTKCGAIFVYEYGQRYSKKAFVKYLALEYVYLGRRFCMPAIKSGISLFHTMNLIFLFNEPYFSVHKSTILCTKYLDKIKYITISEFFIKCERSVFFCESKFIFLKSPYHYQIVENTHLTL